MKIFQLRMGKRVVNNKEHFLSSKPYSNGATLMYWVLCDSVKLRCVE